MELQPYDVIETTLNTDFQRKILLGYRFITDRQIDLDLVPFMSNNELDSILKDWYSSIMLSANYR